MCDLKCSTCEFQVLYQYSGEPKHTNILSSRSAKNVSRIQGEPTSFSSKSSSKDQSIITLDHTIND